LEEMIRALVALGKNTNTATVNESITVLMIVLRAPKVNNIR
jgi:hypothetical protein